MKTTFKSVALFVVVLGISAVGLSGTASAAHGSGGKTGSAHSGQINHTPSHSMGSRPQESAQVRFPASTIGTATAVTTSAVTPTSPATAARAGTLATSRATTCPNSTSCRSRWRKSARRPARHRWRKSARPRFARSLAARSARPPCRTMPAAATTATPAATTGTGRDYDKRKDHDPKHGSSGKDGPPRIHPLTETQHGTASANLGKTAMKVAGNSRGGQR